jgi:hypothetical protein
MALVREVDGQPRARVARPFEHGLGQRLRHDLAGGVVGRAEQHQLRLVLVEQAAELACHSVRIGVRQVAPGGRVDDSQPDDVGAGRREGELALVVGVGRIQQQHRVARIHERAEQVVRQLRAAHPDGDVLRAQARDAEERRLELRDLLSALEVAERGGVPAAPVEERRVADHLDVGLPEVLRRLVVHPPAPERDHLVRVQSHGDDVLALGHLHDLPDGRGRRQL